MFIESQRDILIKTATTNPEYIGLCKKVNKSYAEDLFQEVCTVLLTTPENKLPPVKELNFWFYGTARNMMGEWGNIGKVVWRGHYTDQEIEATKIDREIGEEGRYISAPNKDGRIAIVKASNQDEPTKEEMLKLAEEFMLSLPEFENRILLLYKELGCMKKVQRATGISYSALRYVKEKAKAQAWVLAIKCSE